jgi:hypothetical protein
MKNYFLDINTNLLKPCDPSCNGCLGSSTSCILCVDGLYKIDESNICLKSKYNYFLDSKTTTLKKCYDKCDECTGDSTSCIKCITGYFKLQGTNTCTNLESLTNHFLEGANKTFYPCDNTCSGCVDNKNNCINCPTGYNKIDGTNTCKMGNSLLNWYLDPDSTTFKKCISKCNACSNSSANCTNCATGYFKIFETNTCTTLTSISNFHLDTNLRRFKKCDPTCN